MHNNYELWYLTNIVRMKKVITILFFCLCIIGCSEEPAPTNTAGTVCGVVSDLKTGNPITNVNVTIYEGLAWDCLGASVGVAFTGTNGFFQITGLDPSQHYFIVFKHSGYRPVGQRVKIIAGKIVEQNIAMTEN